MINEQGKQPDIVSRWIVRGLLLGLGVLVISRLESIFTTPIIDSYRWWGDESWLMTEFMTQMREGVFRHPYAFGASIQHSSGTLLGSMWLSALIYGGLAALLHHVVPDIVEIGRVISTVVSVVLLSGLWKWLRRLTVSAEATAIALILLAATRGFFYMAHSARYDMLSALAILAFVIHLVQRFDRAETSSSLMQLGAIFAMGLTISSHVVLLTALPLVAYLLHSGVLRQAKLLMSLGVGVVLVAVCLVGIQLITSEVSFFGSSPGSTFLNNVGEIPIMRPFSRSVQSANVIQKVKTLLELGIVVLYCTPLCILALGFCWKYILVRQRLAVILSGLIVISWILFESAAPTSYAIYVLPPLCLMSAIAIDSLKRLPLIHWDRSRFVVASVALLLLTYSATRDLAESNVGKDISVTNEAAVRRAMEAVRFDKRDTSERIIAFNPALHFLLEHEDSHPMTTHFIEFPRSRASVHEVIANANAGYLLIYHSALKPDYMREVGPLTKEANNAGSLMLRQVGVFTDIGRTYGEPHLGALDTIDLYRLKR